LLGARPLGYDDVLTALGFDGTKHSAALGVAVALVDLGFAVVTLLKGKVWTGLLGLFVPMIAQLGAIRLARPGSPWARWRYPLGSRKLLRARHREARVREPLIRTKIRIQEFISGRHDM